MKLPAASYDSAAAIQAEPPVRIQLLMHYAQILPPPPVELKRYHKMEGDGMEVETTSKTLPNTK
eukprot:3818348-Amphidinium_carterae.1